MYFLISWLSKIIHLYMMYSNYCSTVFSRYGITISQDNCFSDCFFQSVDSPKKS